MSIAAIATQTSAARSIECDPQVFSANFNRVPFEVTHSLAGNPLFDVERIVELTQRVESRQNPHRPYGDIYSNIGEVGPGMKAVEGHRPAMPASELLRRIEGSAVAAGAQTLWLHVAEENAAAIRLYQARGYLPLGREEDYYAPAIPALIFSKSLEP